MNSEEEYEGLRDAVALRAELDYFNSCMIEHWDDLESSDKKHSYIKDMLVSDILKVTFTKVNGDTREMYCTLQDEFVPEHKKYFSEGAKPREKNMETLSVFDMEKGDWRSFRIENVTKFELIQEENLDFEFDKIEQDYSDVPF